MPSVAIESDYKSKDAALRFRINEIESRLQQILSSEERALLVVRLRELKDELVCLTEAWSRNPCPYKLAEFNQHGKAVVNLPRSANVADFLHSFAHVLIRNLSPDKLANCKKSLGSKDRDSRATVEELFACAFERFYWDDDASDPNPTRESIRNALRKVYPRISGTRIDVSVSPELRDLLRVWCRENPPRYGVEQDTPAALQLQSVSAAVSQQKNSSETSTLSTDDATSRIPWQLLCACTLAVVVGLFKLPYAYYTILRTILCVAAAYGFSLAWQTRSDKWLWVYGVAAVLYNPIFPVRLGNKELWIALNILTVVVFWAHFVRTRANRKQSRQPLLAGTKHTRQ
jgi:hypothetical protein